MLHSNPLLTAMISLLVVLAMGPMAELATPPGYAWLTLVIAGCGFGALQYMAAQFGDASPYLTHSQRIGITALVAALAGAHWQGWAFGMATGIALGQCALLFTGRFETQFYLRLIASASIMLLSLVTSASTSGALYFMAYGALLITLRWAHQQPTPLNWPQLGGHLASLTALVLCSSLIWLLLPHWPLSPSPVTARSPTPYQDSAWDAKANDLRDGRLPVEILPQLQQQFLLNAQQPSTHPLADYSYEAAAPSSRFSYAPFTSRFEINNFASRLSWVDQPIALVQAPSPMNLRAKVFDEFDGIRWHSNSAALYKIPLPHQHLIWSSTSLSQGAPIGYRVKILANIGTAIPITGQLQTLDFPATSLGFDSHALLQSPSPLQPGTAYSAQVQRLGLGLRRIGDPQHLQHLNYRQLPANLDPRIKPLAQSLTQTVRSDLQKAELLEAWLRRTYRYHFHTVAASVGVEPVADFLFDSKRGSSEYFATSLALMLRSLDIPARLVSGLAVQRRNPFTGWFEVYGADAHTWVEAYVDNKGWIELEPMAFYQRPLQAPPSLLGWSPLRDWHIQTHNLQALQTNAPPMQHGGYPETAFNQILLAGLLLALAGAAMTPLRQRLTQHPRWLNWQKNRWIKQSSGQDASLAIACLGRIFERCNISPPPGTLMEVWAQPWQRLVPTFSAHDFAQAYNHHFFGLNTQGDLPSQCQHLLTQLAALTWQEIHAGLT